MEIFDFCRWNCKHQHKYPVQIHKKIVEYQTNSVAKEPYKELLIKLSTPWTMDLREVLESSLLRKSLEQNNATGLYLWEDLDVVDDCIIGRKKMSLISQPVSLLHLDFLDFGLINLTLSFQKTSASTVKNLVDASKDALG